MKATKSERMRAEQVSAAIDQLMQEPNASAGEIAAAIDQLMQEPNAAAGEIAADDPALHAAGQLARLPVLLGPPDPALEELVMRQVRVERVSSQRRIGLRVGWAVAGLAAVVLLMMLVTPFGQTAVASFMAVFDLGRTEVRVTPAVTGSLPSTTAGTQQEIIRQSLTLDEAQAQVSFDIPQPASLPQGYDLVEVAGLSYPNLPAWVPQPFLLELVYDDGQAHRSALRLYPIVLGERANISGLNLEASPIQDVQDVEINGQPGVLLQLGDGRAEAAWKEVVWEQGDLILALSATHLTEAELMDMARSVR